MNLKKHGLWKCLSFPAQVALTVIIGAFLCMAVIRHVNEGYPEKNKIVVQEKNKAFFEYTEKHHCRRYELWPMVNYFCDDGTWSENDLMRKIAGKYPFSY